jgi:hypothetical protein
MKEFIAKYQKAIVGTGAVAVLVVCYFQQRELSKLRAEQKIEVVFKRRIPLIPYKVNCSFNKQ